MNLLLVDTGPLVALANKRDKYHQKCSTFLERYRGRLLTTWSVLTEFSHLAHSVSATLALYQWYGPRIEAHTSLLTDGSNR